jgi:hypothetical protein
MANFEIRPEIKLCKYPDKINANLIAHKKAIEGLKLTKVEDISNLTNSSTKIYLYENNERTDEAPSINIKNKFQKMMQQKIDISLKKKWTNINVQATKSIIIKSGNRNNRLDNPDIQEHKFKAETITKSIKTMEMFKSYQNNIINTDQCQRCLNETEDYDHIFRCPKSSERLQECKHKAIELMKHRKTTSIHYNKIKEETNSISEEQLLNIIGINENSFLELNPTSRGIITNELIRTFNLKTPKEMNHKDIWLKLTVDAWISGFYDKTMKDRKKAIMELREKLTNEREKTRIAIGGGTKKRMVGVLGIGDI